MQEKKWRQLDSGIKGGFEDAKQPTNSDCSKNKSQKYTTPYTMCYNWKLFTSLTTRTQSISPYHLHLNKMCEQRNFTHPSFLFDKGPRPKRRCYFML